MSGQTFSFTSTGEEKERMEGEENEKGEEKDKRSELCVQNATVFLVGTHHALRLTLTERTRTLLHDDYRTLQFLGGRIDDGWIGRHRWMDR